MSALGVYLSSSPLAPGHVTERSWRAVFVGDDEAPETIVTWLADRVREREGDVRALVSSLVPASFSGWDELLTASPLDPDEPVLVGPDALDDTTFVYLFDIEARRLDVFATHSDASGERIGSLAFDDAGAVAPWALDVPVPPRLLSPVVPGWAGSKPFADSTSRAEDLVELTRALERRGLEPTSAIATLARSVSARWRAACGGASKVLLPPEEVSGFWAVRLHDLDVWYPVPGQRMAVYGSPSELRLFPAGSGEPVLVEIAFETMTEDLGEAVIDALREVATESGWVFLLLDLLRAEQVPEVPSASSP